MFRGDLATAGEMRFADPGFLRRRNADGDAVVVAFEGVHEGEDVWAAFCRGGTVVVGELGDASVSNWLLEPS